MSQFRLLRQKNFAPLFWTQFLGAFNDNFLKNALIIIATFQLKSLMGIPSEQLVVVSGGIFILPFFLFSATAGQLADKYDKIKIIRVVKIVEIFIMLLSAAGLLLQRYEILLFTLFMMGVHSTFFGPVKYSILPQHLKESELVGGNALVEAGTFLSILLGTIGGGVLISIKSGGSLVVSLGLVSVAIAGYFSCLRIPSAPATDKNIKVEWNPVTPTWKVIQTTRKNKTVFLSIMGISWFWFFGGAVLSLFPHYCKDTLRASEGVVTLFLAVFSVGIGLGSLLCERFSRKRLELGLVPLGSIGITFFSADLYRIGSPNFDHTMSVLDVLKNYTGINIVLDLLFLSLLSGLFIVPLNTLIQERSDAMFRSRIIAANNIINALFMVMASGSLVLMLSLGLSYPQIFLVLAILNGIVAIYIYTLLPEFLFRFIAWGLANIMYKLRVEGDENIPSKGPVILVCNHVSFIDWLIVAAAFPRPTHFVMDYSMAKGWLMKRLMKRAKVILIAPAKEDPKMLEEAFDQIAHDLTEGEVVCVFPEGKITHDGKLNLFKPGIEKVVTRTPVPVVPLALVGMWGSFFSREGGRALHKMPKRFFSRVILKVGKPIPPNDVTALGLQEVVCKLGGFQLSQGQAVLPCTGTERKL